MSNITGRHPAKGDNGVSPSGNPAPFGGHPSPTYHRLFFGPPRSVFWRAVFGFFSRCFFVRFLLFFLTLFLSLINGGIRFWPLSLDGFKIPPIQSIRLRKRPKEATKLMKLWPLFGVAMARENEIKYVKREQINKNPDPNNNQKQAEKSETEVVKTSTKKRKIAYSYRAYYM